MERTRLTNKEFDGMLYALPRDIHLKADRFLIDDYKGINIIGIVTGRGPESVELDLYLNGEMVELTKIQEVKLQTHIFYGSDLFTKIY